MRIVTVPCLRDNYAYLVICDATATAAVVDPGEERAVERALAAEQVELVAIWNTHHHMDHTGGNRALLAAHPGLAVVGHAENRGQIPGLNRPVTDGDPVEVGEQVRGRVLHTPGHTAGGICLYLEAEAALFTGDTLFGAGCGRLFEGTAAEMYESLSRLAALDDATRIYCGHEYTEANLRFAATVESDNPEIAARHERAIALLDRDQPTVPSTMAEEKATNPFLRADRPAVVAAVQRTSPPKSDDPAAVFAEIRRWKDRF